MIQQNGQPAQVVQIQRTSDDRCEIIVQPTEIQTDTTTHYYTEDGEHHPNYRYIYYVNGWTQINICLSIICIFQMKYSQ